MDFFALQDRFYREYFRSGNIFLYRFEGKLPKEELKKVASAYGANLSLLTEGRLPTRYVFLNPADIRMTGTASFYKARYSKVLSPYEIQRIKNPLTEEDHTIRESLDKETLKKIDSSNSKKITLPLDTDRLVSVFYKKQDYEPFAVPMGFPVLADLSFKDELKKMDMAIARTMQQAILLVTMGTDPDKGGVNQKNLMSMQKLFENQSVGRVLIADYTTKAEFVVPKIAELMSPQKYQVFNEDINMGLNNILVGGEKFANQSGKVEVFLARLQAARETFLNSFLIPEMKRLAKSMGFRSCPEPRLSEISLKDDTLKDKVYTRLYELGVLSQEELVEALQSSRLPRKRDSVESSNPKPSNDILPPNYSQITSEAKKEGKENNNHFSNIILGTGSAIIWPTIPLTLVYVQKGPAPKPNSYFYNNLDEKSQSTYKKIYEKQYRQTKLLQTITGPVVSCGVFVGTVIVFAFIVG